jgi:aspartate aminotransferase-like enzyme
MMARAATVPNRGYYFDLLKFADGFAKSQTHITPALSTMFALQVQVKRMLAEGMEARWSRHMAMARRTWAWVDETKGKGVNVEVLAPEGYRSPCVTTIKTPDPEGGPAIVKAMAAKGWVIGGGYGKMKPSSIRIGHMGDHTMEELDELLGVLSEVVK